MPLFSFTVSVDVTPARVMPSGRIRRAGFVRPSTRLARVSNAEEPGKKEAASQTDPVRCPPQSQPLPAPPLPLSAPPQPRPAPQQQVQLKVKEVAITVQASTKDTKAATPVVQVQPTTKPLGSVTPEKPKVMPLARQSQPAPKQANSGGLSDEPRRQRRQAAAPQVQPEEKKAVLSKSKVPEKPLKVPPKTAKVPEQTPPKAPPKAPKSILKPAKRSVTFSTPLEQFRGISEEEKEILSQSSSSSDDSFIGSPPITEGRGRTTSESASPISPSSPDDSFTDLHLPTMPFATSRRQLEPLSYHRTENRYNGKDRVIVASRARAPEFSRNTSAAPSRKGPSSTLPAQTKELTDDNPPRYERKLVVETRYTKEDVANVLRARLQAPSEHSVESSSETDTEASSAIDAGPPKYRLHLPNQPSLPLYTPAPPPAKPSLKPTKKQPQLSFRPDPIEYDRNGNVKKPEWSRAPKPPTRLPNRKKTDAPSFNGLVRAAVGGGGGGGTRESSKRYVRPAVNEEDYEEDDDEERIDRAWTGRQK